MASVYFRSMRAWDAGAREEAFAEFNRHFQNQLSAPVVFLRPDASIESSDPPRFQVAVEILLTGHRFLSAERLLQAPFARVIAELIQLDDNSRWLEVLTDYDFFEAPSYGPVDQDPYGPAANSEDDLRLLASRLTEMAQRGELSGDENDRLHSGRPVLAISDIEAVDVARWGSLREMLLSQLPRAFAEAPRDVWTQWQHDHPERVVQRFLHATVGRNQELAYTSSIWQSIRESHPDFASAATAALSSLLSSASNQTLDELVRYDAGRNGDGRAWLTRFASALSSGIFEELDG